MKNKLIWWLLLALILMATSVSAYRMSDNYSVNQSVVILYDSFTRNTTSWDLGIADTNQSWVESNDSYGNYIDNINHFQYVNGQAFVDYANDTWYSTPTSGYAIIPITPTDNYSTFEWDYIDENNGTPQNGEFVDIDVNRLGGSYVIAFVAQNSNGSLTCYNAGVGGGYTDPTNFVFNDGNWHHFKIIVNITGDFTSNFSAYMDDQLICDGFEDTWGNPIPPQSNNGDISLQLYLDGNSDAFPRTQLIDDLVGYSGNITPYYLTPSNITWCYQEFANQSTCGDQTAGNYSTNDSTICNIAIYHKPSSALNNSVWQEEDTRDDPNYIVNITLPNECWNSAVLTVGSTCGSDMGGHTLDLGCYDDNMTYYLIDHTHADQVSQSMWWSNTTSAPNCTPNWSCSHYLCLTNDSVLCDAVSDSNNCSMNYTGNFSEFGVGLTCNYCEPSWVCNGYGLCSQNGTQNCNSVSDIYDCFSLTNSSSDLYTGNYSEFTPAGCATPPITGYVPAYGSGDLANITIDMLAKAVLEVIALIGVIVIVALVVFAANRLKRIGGK